jgi:hypothetical protein
MGLMFVPLTLTAVSRVDPADAGVGSAVLNTVQQVGAAVGIAVLGTVYANGITSRAAELAASGPPQDPGLAALQAQVHGTSQTFLVAASLMVAATLITLIGLDIRHQDLATDATPGAPVPVPEPPGSASTLIPPPRAAPDALRTASDAADGTGGRHRAEP